ncbi:hypothetical protein GCM10025788_08280 [Serinicoccus chungangensis]
MGIDQPPKSAIFAPSATCFSCRGDVFVAESLMGSHPSGCLRVLVSVPDDAPPDDDKDASWLYARP